MTYDFGQPPLFFSESVRHIFAKPVCFAPDLPRPEAESLFDESVGDEEASEDQYQGERRCQSRH